MAKKRVLSQKLREEIISYTKKEMATKRFPRHLKFQKTQLAESYASLKIPWYSSKPCWAWKIFPSRWKCLDPWISCRRARPLTRKTPTHQSSIGRGSVLHWRCFAAVGTGNFDCVTGIIETAAYVQVNQESFLECLWVAISVPRFEIHVCNRLKFQKRGVRSLWETFIGVIKIKRCSTK